MSSQSYPLRQIGIYHNLPNFDPNIKNLTAIITGANGISGFYTMRALLDSPERWNKIYALSRRPPPEEMMNLLTKEQRSRVQHVACDFLQPANVIAQAMRAANVTADYVFFYSYLQPSPPPGARIWSNAEELVKVNSALLENFLGAVEELALKPKRVLLQTGAKNYGVHIGRTRLPACESDPQPKHLDPNFYYGQEKILFEFCERNSTDWNVIMPAWIIGAVTNAQMNALHPFAVYAAVQAHKNEPIKFGGDWSNWQTSCFHSTARLTGYLSEWVVLEEKCKNERFNSTDTSPFTFDRFFEELCRWYEVKKGFNPPEEDDGKYAVFYGRSGEKTPMGYGPPSVMKISFSLVEWAKDEVNKKAWQEIIQQSNGKIKHDPFQDPVDQFSCADAAWLSMVLSPNKARRLGWTGFVDTIESVFEMYKDMVELGMLPPMKVDTPKPLI